MTRSSVLVLADEPAAHALPEALRAADALAGVDIGWAAAVLPFVDALSRPGDRVFDPFAGLGTSLIAALARGRHALGVEVSPERFALLARRLDMATGEDRQRHRIWCGDARHVGPAPASVDLLVTSIPYFRFRKASPVAGDLYGESDYDTYLDGLQAVFARAALTMRDGARGVVFAENVVTPEGAFVPLAWDAARRLGAELVLRGEHIVAYPPRPERPGEPEPRNHEYAFLVERRQPPLDQASARQVLARLSAAGIPFLVIGSMAERAAGSGLVTHAPRDLDLWLPDRVDVLAGYLGVIEELGFASHSWQDPVTASDVLARPALLRGRYYLRSARVAEGLCLVDASYELDAVPFEEAWREARMPTGCGFPRLRTWRPCAGGILDLTDAAAPSWAMPGSLRSEQLTRSARRRHISWG